MSVKVMTAVFERYPVGGGEMLLALALADHASDDGTRVYPSVKALAEKTRQSERAVQYQLRKMQQVGWLILVGAGHGGRGMSREYRISQDWINGADFAPIKKGANDDIKGAIHDEKGANDDIKGCNGLHPHITINEPSITTNESSVRACDHASPPKVVKPVQPDEKPKPDKKPKPPAAAQPAIDGVPDALLADWLAVRKAKRAGPLTATAIAGLQREAAAAGMTPAQAVAHCCECGWAGFRADWVANQRLVNAAPQGRGQAGRKQAQSFAEKDYGTGIQVL